MVSIHGPLGYGPSTLPLRHSALKIALFDRDSIVGKRTLAKTSPPQLLDFFIMGLYIICGFIHDTARY